MVKNSNKDLLEQNNLLINQNKLLEQMNSLIKKQNEIFSEKSSANTAREVFVEDIDRDEMRSGFLVTSHRKKLWNVQIGLIKELARICKKHNLKWFACGGTLLGAARHKGFIPWDDDIDFGMMRPDYNKFVKIATEEIKYPYFLDNYYNHRLASDETEDPMNDLPFFTREQEKKYFVNSFPAFPIVKIRDERTSMIEFPDRTDARQGMWIDVFPFDIVPPFFEDRIKNDFEVLRELMVSTFHTEIAKKALENNQKFLIPKDDLKKFISLPFRQRGIQLDNFAEKVFFRSQKVGDLREFGIKKGWTYDTKDFDKIVYLPFEKIEIPAPEGWENVLTSQYGEWRKFVISLGHIHEFFYSADIPYTEFYKSSLLLR